MTYASRGPMEGNGRTVSQRLLACVSLALWIVLAGCMHSALELKMESGSVARRLGVPGCRVSIPLKPSQVLEQARRDGDTNPEARPEWIAMQRQFQSGDQFRLVHCMGGGQSGIATRTYYFALFRSNSVIAEMHHVIVD